MEFFLDTAQVEEIKEAQAFGLVDGVTTNPSLIAKTGKPFEDTILEICKVIDGPVSAEVHTEDLDEMITQGLKYSKIHENVVIKLPLTETGLKACRTLSKDRIKTNVTLCFSANQALLAAKAGATYISPFVGRLDDLGIDGMELIQDIRDIYDNYSFTTKILAASIRHPLHLKQAALAGADVSTIPAKVFHQVFKHPLTDIGQEQFMADWAKFENKS